MSMIQLKEHVGWQQADFFDQCISETKKKYDLDLVCYTRYYDDSFSAIYNNRKCIDYYINQAKLIPTGWALGSGRHYWSNYMPEKVLNDFTELFGFNDGITFISHHHNFCESLAFSINTQQELNALNRYNIDKNTHIEIIQSIKQDANIFFELLDKNRIKYNKDDAEKQYKLQRYIHFNKKLDLPKKLIIQTQFSHVELIDQDIELIFYMLQLYTNTKIAKLMNLTTKSIDYRFHNLKKKLHIKTRYELFQICQKNYILDLLN